MKRKFTPSKSLLILLFIANLGLKAQQSLGLQVGNHNAPYSTFMNPAYAYPDRNVLYLNAWGTNLGFTNNFVRFNLPERLGYFHDNDLSVAFDQQFVNFEGNRNNRFYYLKETYGPSAFFRVNPRWGVGFGVRAISGVSMTGVGKELASLMRYGLDTSKGAFQGVTALQKNKTYHNDAFSISAENYQEWFFSLANVNKFSGQNFWKWGVTGKLLLGMGSANYASSGLDFGFNSGKQIYLENANLKAAHTSDASAAGVLDYPFGLNFKEVQGGGLGMDIGFAYERRKQGYYGNLAGMYGCLPEINKGYQWKFGASITDLGFISYNGAAYNHTISAKKTWNINTDLVNLRNDLNVTDRFDKVDSGFIQKFGALRHESYATTTPMALNAQLDIKMKPHYYLGFNWSQSLKPQSAMGLRKASYLAATPRWETEHAEFGLPITLTRDYSALNVGMYGRLGPVILGTDNLGGLMKYVANNDYKAANIYMALRFKIGLCPYTEKYDEDYVDTFRGMDTTYRIDTTAYYDVDTFIKKDTIIKIKTDTIYKTIIKHDTVYRTSTVTTADVKRREDAVKAKEQDLKNREDLLKSREILLDKREEQLRLRELELGKNSSVDCNKRIAELQTELDKQRTAYANLQKTCSTCSDEKAKCELKIKELENEITKLKSDITAVKNDNIRLKNENENLKSEIVRLKMNTTNPCEKQTKSLDSLLTIERRKTGDLQIENNKLKSDIEAIKKQKTDLEAIVNNNSKKISDLQGQIDALTKENATLKLQLKNTGNCDEWKLKVDALEKELANTKTSLTAEVAKNKALQDKLNATEDCTPYKNKVAELEKKYADLYKEYEFAMNQVKDLQAKLKTCQESKTTNDEIVALKAEIEALKKSTTTLEAKLADSEKGKKAAETEIEAIKKQLTTCQVSLADCEKKGGSGSAEIDALKSEMVALKNKLSTAENKLKECEQSKSDAETENKQLKSDITAIKAKLADAESKLTACQNSKTDSDEINKLKSEITALKNQLSGCENDKSDLTSANNQLKSQIEALKGQLSDCQGKLSNTGSEISALKNQLQEANNKISSLQSQLNECKSNACDCDGLKAQIEDWKSKYNSTKAQYDQLYLEYQQQNTEMQNLRSKYNECQAALKACQEK